MNDFPIPANEDERMKELRKLRFDEWGTSAALNELCAIMGNLFSAPIVHVSLVDETEQLFAGKVGLDVDRTPRDVAFCAHTIMDSSPFIVENAEDDPRFFQNPLVTGRPGIRSYVGIPLERRPGVRIGALCVVDKKPRHFSDDEVKTMSAFADIVISILNNHCMRLELDDQLAGAIALQNDMLPKEERMVQISASCPLDLASYCQQRDGIGGDIWGIDAIGPQSIMIYIADFTGHGVAAALNAARFHSFVHMTQHEHNRPSVLLQHLNQQLCEVLPIGQFATMFCVAIDFEKGNIEYASAGSPPQIYRESADQPFELLAMSSLPLGLLRDATYESEVRPFKPGGRVVLCTDGVLETPKPPLNTLSINSLKKLLNGMEKNDTSKHLRDRIIGHLFSDPTTQALDDVTLIIAGYTSDEDRSKQRPQQNCL